MKNAGENCDHRKNVEIEPSASGKRRVYCFLCRRIFFVEDLKVPVGRVTK